MSCIIINPLVYKNKNMSSIQQFPSSMTDMFQNPQFIPETTDNTDPICSITFPIPTKPMINFNL
jgi:hypothetical protein